MPDMKEIGRQIQHPAAMEVNKETGIDMLESTLPILNASAFSKKLDVQRCNKPRVNIGDAYLANFLLNMLTIGLRYC